MASNDYVESLSEVAKSRYLTKLKAVGVELCPFTIDDGAWLNNPTEWPSVQYADVYNYLIESPSTYNIATVSAACRQLHLPSTLYVAVTLLWPRHYIHLPYLAGFGIFIVIRGHGNYRKPPKAA